MEDARVKELIGEAAAANGAVTVAIQAAIVSSLGDTGAVQMHIQAALAAFLQGPVQEAIDKAKSEFDFDTRGDAEYPFRKILRGASAPQLEAAWQSMMVDPDHIQSLCEGINDNGLATILALQATHPDNPDLRLKQHAALKNAPRQKWKKLCLPELGGGSDRLRIFLLERAETCGDNLIKALARAILALYVLLERRFTVSQNVKKNGPQKADIQRQQLMQLVYESIKAFKRRTTKATAVVPLDNEVLLRDFGIDIMMAESKLITKSGGGILKRELEASHHEGPAKFGKSSGKPQSPSGGADSKGQTKGGKSDSVKELLHGKLAAFVPGTSPGQIQAFLDEHFQRDESRRAMTEVMRNVCRNCLLSNRGFAKHPLGRCRELGYKCVLKCQKCVQAGRAGDITHWIEDCPH